MLRSRHELFQPQPDDLVFPRLNGGFINYDYFRKTIWKPVLASCGVEYKKPYTLRHSGVSHAAANGADLTALAEQTGHSKRILISTYLHAIGQKCLFVDIQEVEK